MLRLDLELPKGLESMFWSCPDTCGRLEAQDVLGLVLGMAIHLMSSHLKTTWSLPGRILMAIAGMMQLAQVSCEVAACRAPGAPHPCTWDLPSRGDNVPATPG